jgi:cephalosporin hydroxylase
MRNNDFTINLSKPQNITYHSNNIIDWKVTLAETGATFLKGTRLKKIEKHPMFKRITMLEGSSVSDEIAGKVIEFVQD